MSVFSPLFRAWAVGLPLSWRMLAGAVVAGHEKEKV